MKVDYLIVGQGLAGSLLSWAILERGHRILVVDRDEEITSSKVAAGLVTPFTGSKFQLTPAFEERLQFAKRFYWDLEEMTGARFFHHTPIIKLFREEQEKEAWERRSSSRVEEIRSYHEPLTLERGLLRDEHGGFVMKGGGWLHVPAFLEATRQHLLERAAYAIGRVDSEDLKATETGARWKNVEAKQVIFAEGWMAEKNPLFDWLKMSNALGDILEVRAPALASLDNIVNRGGWLLPLGEGRFRTGSNYRHHVEKVRPDEKGRKEILEKWKSITPHPAEVIQHESAIRPIIRRSQIFCGIHPTLPHVGFFNGLGSKGVVNGPWFADRYVSHLEGQADLPASADIRGNLV